MVQKISGYESIDMTAHFFCILLLCIVIPALLSRVFRIYRLFPVVFLQLLFGLLLNTDRLNTWLQSFSINLVQEPLLHSFNGLGWLGLSLVIALTGSESLPTEQKFIAWRFIPISMAGFGITYILGGLFGYGLAIVYPELLGKNNNLLAFSLAVGLSLSVTALPILIAILRETQLTNTLIGKLAINCAILDDLWMWLALAVVLSLVTTTSAKLEWIVLYLIIYLLVMLFPVRFLLRKLFENEFLKARTDGLLISITIIFLSAIATDLIGLHVIFGAYVAGIILPHQALAGWRDEVMNFCQFALLPFFFIFTGMRLQIHASDLFFWQLTFALTLLATLSKFLSVALSARLTGLSWPQCFVLGGMMQCKGLMELVAINILFDAGIIGPYIFSALAIMAIISTLITAPCMHFLLKLERWTNLPHIIPKSIPMAHENQV